MTRVLELRVRADEAPNKLKKKITTSVATITIILTILKNEIKHQLYYCVHVHTHFPLLYFNNR